MLCSYCDKGVLVLDILAWIFWLDLFSIATYITTERVDLILSNEYNIFAEKKLR